MVMFVKMVGVRVALAGLGLPVVLLDLAPRAKRWMAACVPICGYPNRPEVYPKPVIRPPPPIRRDWPSVIGGLWATGLRLVMAQEDFTVRKVAAE